MSDAAARNASPRASEAPRGRRLSMAWAARRAATAPSPNAAAMSASSAMAPARRSALASGVSRACSPDRLAWACSPSARRQRARSKCASACSSALPEAERRARRALARLDLLAEPGAASVRLTLASLKLRRGAIAEAYEDARAAAEALRAQGRDDAALVADALQAPGLAESHDWAGLDTVCERLGPTLSGPVQADADVISALKLAARLAESAGRLPLAQSLRALLVAA